MSEQDTADPLAGAAADDGAPPSALERLRALAGERARAAEAEAAARAPRRAPQRRAKPAPVETTEIPELDATDTPPSTVALAEPDEVVEPEPADEPQLLDEEADVDLAAEDEAAVEEYADEELDVEDYVDDDEVADDLEEPGGDVEAEPADELAEPAAAEAVTAKTAPAKVKAAPRPRRERKRRARTTDPRRRRTLALLSLITVVAAGLAVWFGIAGASGNNDPQGQADASRAAAQAASVQAVKDLYTVDYNNPADWLKRVTGDSTGSLVTDYKSKESVLFALLKGTETKITATVQRAGADFTNASRTQASSLVIASERQVDKTHPAGVSEVQGYQVKVSLVGGRWLATFIQPVGTTVS